MPKQNHTTSIHNKYSSIKDLGWSISATVQMFLTQDRATTAKRMKDDGLRTSQIARYMFGSADKQTISKVAKLLREVA